ncbi:hypothetical protein [Boseongicola aestuarii]|uniref:DUF4148 domain-containing protein n=1 Tax=Boseongicola aestuarii TaxID=1470561 RepID=A0A238IZJ5_9RHOB|nr:hypothetical protein [Boseongicola aestuarii]SMX23908.1 hypothetical protein BOA8489_02021 [Boseongicola aestuarii]
MKTLLVAALVATTAFAGAASAMTGSKVDVAQDTLVEYGFNVDADTLSAAQVNALNTLSVDTELDGPRTAEGRVLTKIRAILN